MATFSALCALGAERILANELKKLGFRPSIAKYGGRVDFEGKDGDFYRANLQLRTADRVFLQAARFFADDFDALFDGAQKVDWQDFFFKNARIVVDKVRCNRSRLHSEHSVQKIVHKAICQKLCRIWRMSSLPETGDVAKVRVYIDENCVRLMLDLSGEPLHKRGWRGESSPLDAPLRETVAASLLQMAMWRRKTPLLDPFCGSGTIAVEAMLFACNIAPGLFRRFAFESLKFFDENSFAEQKKACAAQIRTDCKVRIVASDIDSRAAESAEFNIQSAALKAQKALREIGRDEKIVRPVVLKKDFRDLTLDIFADVAQEEQGQVVCNPPYGLRLGDEAESVRVCRDFPALFSAFSGWKFGFLMPRDDLDEIVDRKCAQKRGIKCGNIENVFWEF